MQEAEDAAAELEDMEETVQKLNTEIDFQKQVNADDRKQLQLVKNQLEKLKYENELLRQ